MEGKRLTRKSRAVPETKRTGTLIDVVQIPVPCPQCNKQRSNPLRQLIVSDSTTCRACRAPIDLTIEPWHTLIKETANLYRQFRHIR
jgi:hypothetical protein